MKMQRDSALCTVIYKLTKLLCTMLFIQPPLYDRETRYIRQPAENQLSRFFYVWVDVWLFFFNI